MIQAWFVRLFILELPTAFLLRCSLGLSGSGIT